MSVISINPRDSIKILSEQKDSFLIDVRTPEEINFVGFPELSNINKNPIFIPWKILPNMSQNENFEFDLVDQIKTYSDKAENEISLLFLCRSGARSMEAALFMSDIGYKCYNIKNGFEGDLNDQCKRSQLNGWKFDNNPWKQN